MKIISFFMSKGRLRRIEALFLVVILTTTSVLLTVNVSAETVSWKNDISSTLKDVSDGMENSQNYEDALAKLNSGLDGLESAATVDGLAVTQVGTDFVTLEWDAFNSEDIVGYNVYWADKDTDTQVYAKLKGDGTKAADDDTSSITVENNTTSFTYNKSTHVNYYFKVSPVLKGGEGAKTASVKSPTATEFDLYLENLDRGLVVVPTSGGMFLSWRLLGTEVTGYSATGLTGTDFNVYKDGTKLATVTDSTNYMVTGGAIESTYTVVPIVNGEEVAKDTSDAAIKMTTGEGAAGYMDIALQAPANTTIEETYGISTAEVTLLKQNRTDIYSTTEITYAATDVSVGDVDADGEYEFIVKWDPSLAKDVSQQGYTGKQYIDCYELDGTLRWRIDLGINIRSGAHYTEFLVEDYNQDGYAEVAMKTAPGTKILTFKNNNQNEIATEKYITIPEEDTANTENTDNYVYSAAQYREHLIKMFMDWGVWANDSKDMTDAKAAWDKNLINLFAPESGKATVTTKNADGTYTSTNMSLVEAGFNANDVVVNVPIRDADGNVVYHADGVANAYMQTVLYNSVGTDLTAATGLVDSMNHVGGYTVEEATALADYFLSGYQYRMKKHNLNNYEGYIISGSEYLTVFNGMTGAETDTIMYPFAREDDGMLWGDYAMNYMEPGNRNDRFLATTAYLDGETPSMVFARGYYTRATIATYKLSAEGKFVPGWTIDSGWTVMTNPFNDGPHGFDGNNTDTGTNGVRKGLLSGQGDHYMTVGDVDSDGCQEIIFGGAIVDNNGDLYSSGRAYLPDGVTYSKYGHGDSIHLTDIDPDRPGLEMFSCFEGGTGAPYGTALRDAATNVAIAGANSVYSGADTGRCIIGDFNAGIRGIELSGMAFTDCKGNVISGTSITTNQNLKFCADMTTQGYLGTTIGKANGTAVQTVATLTGTSSNNGTKGNAGLIADILGDWREEVITRTTDSSALRIYTSTEVTSHKMYTLMHDTQYRAQVSGQNSTYNQPSYTSFYFAADTDWGYVPIPTAKKDQEPGIVEIQPTSVSFDNTSLMVKEGAQTIVTANFAPEKTTNKTVTYTSSDQSIATVSNDGTVTGVKAGTTTIIATTQNGLTATIKVYIKAQYKDAGTDTFAMNGSKAFTFGTAAVSETTLVGKDAAYTSAKGFGWDNAGTIALNEGTNYVAGNNVRTAGTTTTYDYPTFVLDVPAGIYEVTLVQGSDTVDSVNGAYMEGDMYSVRWNEEAFSTSFTEPSALKNIVTIAGTDKTNTVTTAVADGQLTIQLATSLTDAGVSGTTYIKSINVKRVSQIIADSENPTLRFIGDSTVATYPPEDGGTWTPIPERTGWGSEFALKQFMKNTANIVNKAVAGSSIKSYVSDGYYNDFFRTSHPGDTVVIEGGINDSAAGRRYCDAASYEAYLRYFISSCQAFGLDVVISSGTSSATTYTAVMQKLSTELNLPYIDLLTQYNTYKSTITAAEQGDMTVDGTHLTRVGGVIAAQIVANGLSKLEGLSISGYVNEKAITTTAPTAVATGLSAKAQTAGSVTLAWAISEDTLYDPDQLITRFNVYRKAKGADNSTFAQVGQTRAYVSASMSAPKLEVTIEAPVTGSYDYAVSVVGFAGEGTKTGAITVDAYTATARTSLYNIVEKYSEQLYDATHYTAASYAVLKLALTKAEAVLADGSATDDTINTTLTAVNSAVSGLVLNVTEAMKTDFQSEASGSIWGTTGHTLLSVKMEDNGNKLANTYVEAAGTRNTTKAVTAVDSKVLDVEFEWLPGQPDTRNCVEVQLKDAAGAIFSLKTSNNGHIGYVVGDDTTQIAYLQGDGFQAANTLATDCGLTNDIWYNVRVVFNFNNHTADLYLVPRDDFTKESAVVKDIAISAATTQITTLNFLSMRGKNDAGGNDLSVLWDTYMDNFGIYYAAEEVVTDATGYNDAVTAYDAAIKGIAASTLTNDEFALAGIVKDIMDANVGFATTADYAYAISVLDTATKAVPTQTPATSIATGDDISVVAGLSKDITATMAPTNANEEITWSSSDKTVATVTGNGSNATVKAQKAGSTTITATTTSGKSDSMVVTVVGTVYTFGTNGNVTAGSAYNKETGFGFNNYTYPDAAAGFVADNSAYPTATYSYIRRNLSKVSGTSYVDANNSATDYLAINAQAWNEMPVPVEGQSTRDEDIIKYVNTSSFDMDLKNGNYEVTLTLTNPSKNPIDVVVDAEDIVRYTSGDNANNFAAVTLGGYQTKTVTFNIALTDGQLTLRFAQNTAASTVETAGTKTVCVKSVSVVEDKAQTTGDVPTIFIAGDSTVQTYTDTSYRASWAQLLYTMFGGTADSVLEETSTGYAKYKTASVVIENYARDARSTVSFLEEGRLNKILLNVKPGDYVFAQLGHNDDYWQRTNRAATVEEYKANLLAYKKAIEERGGTFVLVTPISLASYTENGSVEERFTDYREGMLELAAANNIPVIDLMGSTVAMLNGLGSVAAVDALSMYRSDYVHTLLNGGKIYTQLVANLIGSYNEDNQLDTLKSGLTQVNVSVVLPERAKSVIVGQTAAMPATTTGLDGTTVKYVSSNAAVATIDANGVVTAVAEGNAIITAIVIPSAIIDSVDDTVYTDNCLVTVKSEQVAGIKTASFSTPNENAVNAVTIEEVTEDAVNAVTAEAVTTETATALFNATVASDLVEEVKAYDATAWKSLQEAIAVLNIKMGLMADDSTPLNFDASFANKMIAVREALKTVEGMSLVDVTTSEDSITRAEKAIANQALYTESSLATVATALEELNAVIEKLDGMNAIVTQAISTMDYWLTGIDTTSVPKSFSLYADMDIASTTTAYKTAGYTSITRDKVYSAETGYGLASAFANDKAAGRNRASGNSLLDDWFFASKFKADLPAGNYKVTYYSGDLMAGCKAKSQITITDASGKELAKNDAVTAAAASYTVRDVGLTVAEAGTIDFTFGGYYNAILIEQIVDIDVDAVNMDGLKTLVEKIDAEKLQEANYTVSSWAIFSTALADANEIIIKGSAYIQQYQPVVDALNKAYDGLVPRNIARELLIDFGTTTSAVSDVTKLGGDGGHTTIGTNIIQGLPTMLYTANTLDNGQHFGFNKEVNANETASGGAYFRDYVYGAGGTPYTFTADLPVGTYYVYVYTGDKLSDNTTMLYFGDGKAALSTGNTAVSTVDGKTVYTQISSGGGQSAAASSIYTIEVTESDVLSAANGYKMGTASLTLFDSTAGLAADAMTARLNGIEFTPVDPTAPLVPVDSTEDPTSYSVTVRSDDNGTANATFASAIAGETIQLKATPADGYHFSSWTVISGDVTIAADNTFTMPSANVTVNANFVKNDSETPTETPTDPSTETPTETPTDPSTETPTETPIETPIVTPAETPTETSTEASADVESTHTGDSSNVLLYIFIAGISCVVVLGYVIIKKNEKKREREEE
ncbi:rhamnogalacturonan lyase family protein [[Clostridium] fimetarium]|uniref:Ig-like domain (Group 2) n=1 Tax=[Clostridium] fimetarium TaxID=99656 RepID=A0A1I0M4D5_9FIRM|nr:Ig-like domain-containing protein [[Clostridium] fimetarium]SEV83345.1 Ig-like domain (group 2) [[Clostridium] fimetarium]